MSRTLRDPQLYLDATHEERDTDCYTVDTAYTDEPQKRRFVDVVPKTFLNSSHPTIASGPSHNATLQLTAIPTEIRAKIYPHLVSKTQYVDDTATKEQAQVHFKRNKRPEHPLRSEYCCDYGIKCQHHGGYWGISSSSPEICSGVGPPGTINILLVCKKLYHEAVGVLYSENTFEIDDICKFRDMFIDHPQWGIGTTNAQSIRQIKCKIPDGVIESIRDASCSEINPDFESRVDEWTDVLCREFPALESLTCYSGETELFSYCVHCAMAVPENRRGMLWMVARVTEKHPRLKKAIWRAWSAWLVGPVGFFPGFFSRVMHLQIELTPATPTKKISLGMAMNIDGAYVPSKDIILDCARIRSTSWEDLLFRCDWEYELPDTAITSEPSKIETASENVEPATVKTQFLRKWRSRRDARSELATNPMNPKLKFKRYLGPEPKDEMIEFDVNESGDDAIELLEPKEEESESESESNGD